MLLDRFHLFPSGVHESDIRKTTLKVTGQILVSQKISTTFGVHSPSEAGSNHWKLLTGENFGGGTNQMSFSTSSAFISILYLASDSEMKSNIDKTGLIQTYMFEFSDAHDSWSTQCSKGKRDFFVTYAQAGTKPC